MRKVINSNFSHINHINSIMKSKKTVNIHGLMGAYKRPLHTNISIIVPVVASRDIKDRKVESEDKRTSSNDKWLLLLLDPPTKKKQIMSVLILFHTLSSGRLLGEARL